MSWSKQQLQAINVRRQNVLVAAAAGSGKTSVLVERIIRRILDEQEAIDVDKVLVVTFTNAAAAEMRSRIGEALSDALKNQPHSRHIERQLVLLNSAAISTIHAFCQNIVRQNFHLLDLDPKFRIAGQAEIDLLQTDVLEGLFEQRYTDGDSFFLELIEHYGDEQSDDSLYSLLLGLYRFSRSHPWPDDWLEHLKDAFDLAPEVEVDATPWSKLLRDKVVLELEQSRQLLDGLIRETVLPGNPAVYADTFAADQVVLDEMIDAAKHSWDSLSGALAGYKFAKIAATGKGIDETVKKYFQNMRQKIKDKVKECKERYFDRPSSELLADMRGVASLVGTLTELTIAFGAEFAKAKQAKGLVDFSDLEHFCLRILLDAKARPGELIPSSVALSLQEKFAEIMVDEYQDTNGVQETILRLVARKDEPNLFMVGDVKQSIYRFRLAEPELFMEKYHRYPTVGSGCARIDLAHNFRSRAGVLHAVNFLFSQLMAPRIAELEYGEAERLNPGPDYPPTTELVLAGPIELNIIDRDSREESECAEEQEKAAVEESELEEGSGKNEGEEVAELSGFELEARLITRRITELTASNYQVFDKTTKQYRKLAWRDIVILLRSVKGKASIMLDVLRQAAIPAYAEVDGGYFQETEVQVMLSLLSVIDNPRQDIQLAGVLRSPLGGFSAAELAEIRLSKWGADLWSALTQLADCDAEPVGSVQDGGCEQPGKAAVNQELSSKALRFVHQLTEWRTFSRRKGVPELIWRIYRDTGYYDYVGGMLGGLLRQANLRALYDRARQYEVTNFRGLFRFLRFIERMKDQGSDLAVARALGESEDLVRVMSIHKSKGLEFPLVFVADLGKAINLQDSKALVLCHKSLGVGPYVTNPETRYRYPTLARYGIAHKLNMETKAEELRILYVALTRAREHLILVGSASKLAKKAAGWCQVTGRTAVTLPDSLIAGAKTYLDWIGPAVVRHSSGIVLRQYADCTEEPGGVLATDPVEWAVKIYSRQELGQLEEPVRSDTPLLEQIRNLRPVKAGEGTDWVEAKLGWRYAHSLAIGKPTKLSVTEIKRRFEMLAETDGHRPFEQPPIITRPRFIQASGKLSAAELGILMHTVMQQADFTGDVSESGMVSQVQTMTVKELLLPEQAAAVDTGAAAAFFATDIGQRMIRSPQVRRELPFSLMLPAERFYADLAGSKEAVFVQGVIDVLFDEPDGLVLLDYKTDRVANSAELAERYATQLTIYAEAVETIFKKPVKEKYLYIFSTREAIRI